MPSSCVLTLISILTNLRDSYPACPAVHLIWQSVAPQYWFWPGTVAVQMLQPPTSTHQMPCKNQRNKTYCVDPGQTAPRGAVWSGSTLFAIQTASDLTKCSTSNWFWPGTVAVQMLQPPTSAHQTPCRVKVTEIKIQVKNSSASIWARPWENVSYAICEQSDQRLCCSLPRQNDTSSLYIRNFKILAGLCSWAGQFVSCLAGDSRRHIFSWHGSYVSQSNQFIQYRINWSVLSV